MQTLLECGERDVLGVGAFEMERVLVLLVVAYMDLWREREGFLLKCGPQEPYLLIFLT
jgi:hypothetical protein